MTLLLLKTNNHLDSKVATLEKIKGNDRVTFTKKEPKGEAYARARADQAEFYADGDR